MKKIFILLFAITFSASFAFAQLTLGGEAKTGLFWNKRETSTGESANNFEKTGLHSMDDAGNYHGRFRLNLDYLNDNAMLGFKIRIQWENWTNDRDSPEIWPYAFGYGNFFNDQLTVSIGKLGSSPWSTGGPEMWKELEMTRLGGVRFEYKPNFIPEKYGKVNIGFVLNGPEGYTDATGGARVETMWDYLQESIIGLSYTHDYFMVRMAFRLDSELDMRNRGTSGTEGGSLIYRLEERIIEKYLPGFQVWALGYIDGVGAESTDFAEYKNWLFIQYAPKNFTAQIRLGYDGSVDRSEFYAKPSFFYKFFDGLLEVGTLFGIGQDFGNGKIYAGSPYSFIEVKPKLQVNFAPGAYLAFEYYYKRDYYQKEDPPIRQEQYINLRFGINF
jgi:hypothetical protein